MRKRVVIGTRGSRLAQVQAKWVLAALANIYPDIEFSLSTIVTTGDRQKSTPVELIPGRGAFVKELEEALLGGKVDLAVHSLKDLPIQGCPGLAIAAVTQRLDPRDVLVSRAGKLNELPPNSLVGTGSPRRTAQLLAYRPDLKVPKIRGNIDTRLNKVTRGEVDGIIVAAAGLFRLGWEDRITEYLPVEHFLPEAGQGALAIEARADDNEMLALVRSLHHEPSWKSVVAERAFVRAMGGGCATVIACLGMVAGNTIRLQGMAAGSDKLLYAQEEGSALMPEEVAQRLAQKLLVMGAIRSG